MTDDHAALRQQILMGGDLNIFPADSGDQHHTVDLLAVDLDQVKKTFETKNLLDDQVVFLQGWFKDPLPALKRTFAVVRLDGDMYESTIQSIEALYPRLSIGGYLIVDGYGAVLVSRKAICHFKQKNNITDELHRIDWTGVWWRKS